METPPSNAPKKKPNPSVPPRRGRIKEQIFESLIGSISSAASKTGEKFGKLLGTGTGGASTSTTPPASADTSDGYSDYAGT